MKISFYQLLLISQLTWKTTWTMPHLHKLMTENDLDFYFNTRDSSKVEDYEVIQIEKLPLLKKRGGQNILQQKQIIEKSFSVNAFGDSYALNLFKNEHILTPTSIIVRSENKTYVPFGKKTYCHYMHHDGETVAAMSVCGDNEDVRGMIFTEDKTLEIHPLTEHLQEKVRHWHKEQNISTTQTSFSLVSRHQKPDSALKDRFNLDRRQIQKRAYHAASGFPRYVETGVFVDREAYEKYMRHFGSETLVNEFFLCYLNAVNALLHLPSLNGAIFKLSVVRIVFDPYDFHEHSEDREVLYTAFCEYQAALSPPDDDDPQHWDMGLYLTARDLKDSKAPSKQQYITMGLAYVEAICYPEYSCVIAEIGTTDHYQHKEYPSTGFGSALVLVHEMAHNIAVSHDAGGKGRSCDQTKFIMSPSRGRNKKNAWSSCSVNQLMMSDTPCLMDQPATYNGIVDNPPGLTWGPARQCEMFFLDDPSATYSSPPGSELYEICDSVKCKSKVGIMNTAPALEGTPCGSGKWCNDGKCTSSPNFDASSYYNSGGGGGGGGSSSSYWTDWEGGQCKSGCFSGSKGYQLEQRRCVKKYNGREVPAEGCPPGPSKRGNFCDDRSYCNGVGQSDSVFAKERCDQFARYTREIQRHGKITRAPYSRAYPWKACAIYCQRSGGKGYYTPVVDISSLPDLDPFYPDGTFCYSKGSTKFYCQENECKPESSRGGKSGGHPLELKDNYGGRQYKDSYMDTFRLDEEGNEINDAAPADDIDDNELFIDNDELRPPGF